MDKKTPWYTRMTDDNWATAIKIAAVLVAMPRWIGALLEADGVPLMLTTDTAPWWGLFSALASAGMALVEGVAFWYTLRAWRKYGGGWLFALIVASMATFAVVLTPYIMANVSGSKLANILQGGWIVAWSSCVSLSTILIVASVGYAQPKEAKQATKHDASNTQAPLEHTPSRALNDFDILKLWRAHGQADAWEQVSDIASECLNGNSPRLQAWYGNKRSIAGLVAALGLDEAHSGRVNALVRGLIKPQGDAKSD